MCLLRDGERLADDGFCVGLRRNSVVRSQRFRDFVWGEERRELEWLACTTASARAGQRFFLFFNPF
jgi:hypothetical protein